MRLLFLFLFSICISSSAFAIEGFYKETDFPLFGVSQETAQRVLDTVGRYIDDGCPIVPISKEYGITNAHCTKSVSIFGFSHHFSDGSGHIQKIVSFEQGSFVEVGGEFPVVSEILINPKRWSGRDIETYKKSYEKDWVLVKRDFKSCFTISPVSIEPGQRLLIAGFPSKTFRTSHSSTGDRLFFSLGKASSSLSQNPFYSRLPKKVYNLLEDVLLSSLEEKKLILSDSDTYSGNSGGPILDTEGKLLGISAAGLIPPGDMNLYEYIPHASLGISVGSIQSQLIENGLNPSNYFNCTDEGN